MTDETIISPDSPGDPAAEARRARKPNPRPKKQARVAKPDENPASAPVTPEAVLETVEESAPASGEWPEPEPPSSGGNPTGAEGGKRKRRRKKNKGGKPQESAAQPDGDGSSDEDDDSSPRPAPPQGHAPRPQQPQPPRPKPDSEAVAKLARRIYLSEVGEEGVALIGDGDARELARRCFRLAEIFLEELARRR